MDLATLLGSLNATDVVLLLLLAGAFLLGFFQGVIRQLLGIVAWFFAFALAANVSDPLGSWLSQYWTFFPVGYSAMVAFVVLIVGLLVAGNIAIQVSYKRTPIFARMSFLDEVLGGILAIGLAVLIVSSFYIALRSYYGSANLQSTSDVPLLTEIYLLLDRSSIMTGLRGSLIPGLVALLGPLLPAHVSGNAY
jgi:uncharacterized membrane protein required for colicin V production